MSDELQQVHLLQKLLASHKSLVEVNNKARDKMFIGSNAWHTEFDKGIAVR